LIVTVWPQAFEVAGAAAAQAEIGWLVKFITEVRTVRAEMNVPPSQLGPVLLRDASEETIARALRWFDPIKRLARVSEVAVLSSDIPPQSAQAVVDEATLILPLAGLIDLDAERARLGRESAKAAAEAEKVRRKLENEEFVARAKPEVVEENRDRLAAFLSEQIRLTAALARIS